MKKEDEKRHNADRSFLGLVFKAPPERRCVLSAPREMGEAARSERERERAALRKKKHSQIARENDCIGRPRSEKSEKRPQKTHPSAACPLALGAETVLMTTVLLFCVSEREGERERPKGQ